MPKLNRRPLLAPSEKSARTLRREAAQLSQMVLAVRAGVSIPTLRLYEFNPDLVQNKAIRRALDDTYAALKPLEQTG